MARNILAEMVISLKDNLSADAKKAAESLNQVKKAADALGKAGAGGSMDRLTHGLEGAAKAAIDLAKAGKTTSNWGAGFERTLDRLKATPAEVAKIKRGFNEVATALGNLDARTRNNALKNYLAGAVTELSALRREAQQATGAVTKLSAAGGGKGKGGFLSPGVAGALRFGAAAAGGAGAAYLTGKAIKESGEQAAVNQRELIRQKNAGITAAESARLTNESYELAKKYPSMLPSDIAAQGRLLIPNTANVEKAMELLPHYTQAQVALKTAGGEASKGSDREMGEFSRFVDIINRSQNVDDTKTLLDGFVRARQIDPEAIKASDFVAAAQTGGAAGKGFSTEFWARTMPAIMMQQKGYRSGTDLASAYQNFMVGRGTQQSLEHQQDFINATGEGGLRTGMVKKRGKVVNPGVLVDNDLFAGNPYEWAKKNLVPTLVKDGMLPQGYAKGDYSESLSEKQRGDLAVKMSQLFSNRRGANMFELLLGDMSQLEAIMERLNKAKGAAAADTDQGKDPFVALEGVTNSLKSLGGAVADPLVQGITPGLQGLAEGIASFAKQVHDNGLFRAMLPEGARKVWDQAIEGQKAAREAATANPPPPLLTNYDWRNNRYQNPASYADRVKAANGPQDLGGQTGAAIGAALAPKVDTTPLDNATEKAKDTKAELEKLNETHTANVDAAQIGNALSLTQKLLAALAQVENAASRAGAAVGAAANKAMDAAGKAAARSLYSDYNAAESP